MTGRTLVLGGARSGKSRWAEQRLADRSGCYLATGYPSSHDPDWSQRVAAHRARRPRHWQTVETLEVAGHLAAADDRPLLVDCLTLWLTRTLDRTGAWDSGSDRGARQACDGLLEALQSTTREVVLVSNEVGSGVVPATASGRLFADLLGELNCRTAAVCDEVVLLVAGIAVHVKGGADRAVAQ